MGLRFDDAAIDRVVETVGGHPPLVRRMGSALHAAHNGRSAVTPVTAEDVTRAFKKHRRELHNQVVWMLDHLRRVAPDEERLLRDLALSGEGAFETAWHDVELRETLAFGLERYGLVAFDGDVPRVRLALLRDALQKPSTTEFTEQKRALKDLVDVVEAAIRSRIAADLTRDRSPGDALDALTGAIPGDARNRPLDRKGLIDLGQSAGFAAVLEALNWGDYEILLAKFYEELAWGAALTEREDRLSCIKTMFAHAHLVRHNNDRELAELIKRDGYPSVHGRFCTVRELVSAGASPPSR